MDSKNRKMYIKYNMIINKKKVKRHNFILQITGNLILVNTYIEILLSNFTFNKR